MKSIIITDADGTETQVKGRRAVAERIVTSEKPAPQNQQGYSNGMEFEYDYVLTVQDTDDNGSPVTVAQFKSWASWRKA